MSIQTRTHAHTHMGITCFLFFLSLFLFCSVGRIHWHGRAERANKQREKNTEKQNRRMHTLARWAIHSHMCVLMCVLLRVTIFVQTLEAEKNFGSASHSTTSTTLILFIDHHRTHDYRNVYFIRRFWYVLIKRLPFYSICRIFITLLLFFSIWQ